MDGMTYIFLIVSLMVCCFLLGVTLCFAGMTFYRYYCDVEESEDDAIDCCDIAH